MVSPIVLSSLLTPAGCRGILMRRIVLSSRTPLQAGYLHDKGIVRRLPRPSFAHINGQRRRECLAMIEEVECRDLNLYGNTAIGFQVIRLYLDEGIGVQRIAAADNRDLEVADQSQEIPRFFDAVVYRHIHERPSRFAEERRATTVPKKQREAKSS